MSNFDAASAAKQESVKQANNLLDHIRHLYASGKSIQAQLALYQAGTDTAFNAAVNALFTAGERTELSAMLSQVNTLVSSWETSHRAAIGLPEA
jgi:hypothetical protein